MRGSPCIPGLSSENRPPMCRLKIKQHQGVNGADSLKLRILYMQYRWASGIFWVSWSSIHVRLQKDSKWRMWRGRKFNSYDKRKWKKHNFFCSNILYYKICKNLFFCSFNKNIFFLVLKTGIQCHVTKYIQYIVYAPSPCTLEHPLTCVLTSCHTSPGRMIQNRISRLRAIPMTTSN